MVRKPVAFLVALYAIAFAFLAMTVVRWPTLMSAVAMMFREEGAELTGFDWRALGLQYGAPYLAAALFFQISSYALATRQHGAFTAFVFGCATAFPMVFVFDMREGWMAAPRTEEWVVVWITGATLLLLGAVWDLRRRPDEEPIRRQPPRKIADDALEWRSAGVPLPGRSAAAEQKSAEPERPSAKPTDKPKGRHWKPVPPAVLAQRRRWAEEGRREREKRAAQAKSRRK
jgi:hypothetical protein